MSKPEAMVRFGIVSATPLKQWCRLYREGGAQALKPIKKGGTYLDAEAEAKIAAVANQGK